MPQTVFTDAASPCCTTTGSLRLVYGLSLRYKRTRKRMNYSERRGQFPRMRILIRPQARPPELDAVRYAPRVCTLVLFIFPGQYTTMEHVLTCLHISYRLLE